MALHINNSVTERNVRAMAARTGETIAEAVNQAALFRMHSAKRRQSSTKRLAAIQALLKEVDSLPRENGHLTPDEIIGYDNYGLPS